jgi:serine protease Do
MSRLVILGMLFSLGSIFSQSLGKDRIKQIDKTVVRITIDSTGSSGTGFVISENGWIATNNHVIQPAFYRNPVNNIIDSIRGIRAEFRNERILEYVVLSDYYGKSYIEGLKKDFIILIPRTKSKEKFSFLKVGKWEDVNEGDEVYTAGYPLSIRQRIISKGLFSTKFETTEILQTAMGVQSLYKRQQAWVDFTLNKGNSGGPVIRMGRKAKHDIVIGLATFLWNPYAEQSTKLAQMINEHEKKTNNLDLNTNKIMAYALEALSKNSLGLSGAVPSDGLYLRLQQ